MSNKYLNKNGLTYSLETTCVEPNCPYFGLGCNHEKIPSDKFVKPLRTTEQNPNTKLVNLIGKLELEEAQLKENKDRNNFEVQLLRQIKLKKDEKIKEMNEKLKWMKLEKEKLEEEVIKFYQSQTLLDVVENLDEDVNQLKDTDERNKFEIKRLKRVKMANDKKIKKMYEEMNAISKEKEGLANQLEIFHNQLDFKVSSFDYDIKKRNLASKSESNHFIDEYYDEGSISLERVLFWTIDNVSVKRKEGELIVSEYFYSRKAPYKLRLSLGCYGPNLEIRLLVYYGPNDVDLKWPRDIDVMINIINRLVPEKSMKLSGNRQLLKPSKNYFKSSERFVFPFFDIFNNGLLKGDLFVVECFVSLK